MRSDLQGLEITKGELRHLSGVNATFRRPKNTKEVFRLFWKFVGEILWIYFCFYTLVYAIDTLVLKDRVITYILVQISLKLSNLLLHNQEPSLWKFITKILIFSSMFIVPAIIIRAIYFFKNRTTYSRSLLDEVENYNYLIKSIDIIDQLEAAGNYGVNLNDRERVIEALKLTREDLVRALKTERILRENKHFIERKPELFANNLTALTSIQVSEKASEHGQLLNEALQIVVEVQEQMRKLQHRR